MDALMIVLVFVLGAVLSVLWLVFMRWMVNKYKQRNISPWSTPNLWKIWIARVILAILVAGTAAASGVDFTTNAGHIFSYALAVVLDIVVINYFDGRSCAKEAFKA